MRLIKRRKTFEKVLNNSDDQVTVGNLLNELVPEDIKQEIVTRFNEMVAKHNNFVAEQQKNYKR